MVYVGKPNSDMTSQVTWAKELLANNGFNVIDIVLEGDVEKSIIDYQEKNSIDMKVVGSYGHSKIRQFLLVLRRPNCYPALQTSIITKIILTR